MRGDAARVLDLGVARDLVVPGRVGEDWVVASETCALDLLGAEFEREVGAGELVIVDEDGLRSILQSTQWCMRLRRRERTISQDGRSHMTK